MKKTFHLCLSSDDEVMFRDEEDYNRGFNCFALALHKTDSTGLVETFMSTHAHLLVQTTDPNRFMGAFRMPYTKYFNRKYSRNGSLGEPVHFCMEIEGLYHHIAAMSYILRNGLHHGIVPIAYGYPHCSINAIFQKDMGKVPVKDLIPQKSFYRYIGRNADFPDRYKMSSSGVFLRESVLDIAQVENMFATPRAFNYYMNRKTSEEWMMEQEKDKDQVHPVTLELIESKVHLTSVKDMLVFEGGRSDYKRKSDIELCVEIDMLVRELFQKSSIYTLTDEEKHTIARVVRGKYFASTAQLSRCLAIRR
jgi:hypothetical protein